MASGSTSVAIHLPDEKCHSQIPAAGDATFESIPAHPTTFPFLDRTSHLIVPKPDCGVPSLQSAFEAVYDRYETALKNRQKVDEKLCEFKQVIGAHARLHMSDCFNSWRDKLTNPVFTISCDTYNLPLETPSKEKLVKQIKVRSDNMPRHLWKAVGTIRDVLNACTLYIQQYAFLRKCIAEGMSEIVSLSSSLGSELEGSNLTRLDKEYLVNELPQLVLVYGQTETMMAHFLEEIVILLREITESVDCLRS